ncbi:jg18903 [Pararge aegeria aegeria]|uniref:Jg18903 protein n=1 Tax=Pararge aegeria aegeria TaxID=348720 RepID=A0A8S4QUG4_9NEOP|nr:jg18903 [Pararge aegeria aegeria]
MSGGVTDVACAAAKRAWPGTASVKLNESKNKALRSKPVLTSAQVVRGGDGVHALGPRRVLMRRSQITGRLRETTCDCTLIPLMYSAYISPEPLSLASIYTQD